MRWLALGLAVFGIAAAAMGQRAIASEGRPYLWLVAVGLVGIAAYFGLLRTGLDLDAQARQVTVWWRWLALSGRRTIDGPGKQVRVERTISRSRDSGSTELFRILLDDCVLHTFSEYRGGADAAEAFARRVAAHVGVPFEGQRDCPHMVRREAWRTKHALLPLTIACAAMAVGLLLVLFRAT